MKTSISPGRIVCSPNSGSKKPHLGAEEKEIFYMHSDIYDSDICDSDIWDSDIWEGTAKKHSPVLNEP